MQPHLVDLTLCPGDFLTAPASVSVPVYQPLNVVTAALIFTCTHTVVWNQTTVCKLSLCGSVDVCTLAFECGANGQLSKHSSAN